MILSGVKNIHIGSVSVKKLAVGDKIVWPNEFYLEINPDTIWIFDAPVDVQIQSNTTWKVV